MINLEIILSPALHAEGVGVARTDVIFSLAVIGT